MKKEIIKKNMLRQKRTWRVRKRMHGTSIKPRLSVRKSNKHLHVQLIDDEKGHTLASVSTAQKEYRDTSLGKKSKESAKKLGELIGAIAVKNNIKELVFDRGPHKYHGILAELANAARQAGLIF